ncbi:MAG: GNAT family N-acetyltransferase [Clostridia bacterium]|nr:GNAT family N-acetyltransferase [Clostridia bacterium]
MTDLKNIKIDNNEPKIKYSEIILFRENLENLPEYDLPDGYGFCFYNSEKDKSDWIEIEKSAREMLFTEQGIKAWQNYYGGKEEKLFDRMLFVVSPDGEKVATATAFYDEDDGERAGWLYWVAVKRDFQGKGLSKPLIAKTLRLMRDKGYENCKIPTQPNTWLAVKIYLDFGFLPYNTEESREGYRILRTILNHKSLRGFEPLPWEDIFDRKVVALEEALRKKYPEMADYSLFFDDGVVKFTLKGEKNLFSENFEITGYCVKFK